MDVSSDLKTIHIIKTQSLSKSAAPITQNSIFPCSSVIFMFAVGSKPAADKMLLFVAA